MSETRLCPECRRPVEVGPCPHCLLGPASGTAQLGARPLWEDLGEAGDVFEVIDGFAVIRRLGEGGMGEVFLARQLSTGREVALKLLRESVPLARFRKEIAALAVLRHAGVVPIVHAGEHGGRPYFAMEYVDGSDLAVRVRTDPPTVREAVGWMVQVARAIGHAHGQGILHRDLKPQNVLVGSDGAARVTDFGLARFLGEEGAEGRTVSGAAMGTPAYMAPEQVRGTRSAEGPWTDVHGMGATLYCLLTGVAPFRAESVESLFRLVLETEPVSPRLLRPGLDRDLETVVLGAMEKDAGARYRSAGEWADDLERWHRGEPVRRRPVGWMGRMVKWSRRRPVVAALSGALVCVAAMGGAGMGWQWRKTVAANRRMEGSLVELRLGEANRLVLEGKVPEALRVLARGLREVPNDTASAARLVSLLSTRRFLLPAGRIVMPGPIAAARWTPDGTSVLAISYQSTNGPLEMRAWDPVKQAWASDTRKLGSNPVDAQFSADGRWLLTQFADGLRLWRAAGLEPVGEPVPGVLPDAEFTWHPQRAEFFSWSGEGRVFCMEAETRRVAWERDLGEPVRSVAISRDGLRLAVGLERSGVLLLETGNGMPVGDRFPGPGPVVGVGLNGDGSRLAMTVMSATERDQMRLELLWWDVVDRRAVGPLPTSGFVSFGAGGVLLQGMTSPTRVLVASNGTSGVALTNDAVPWKAGWLGDSTELATLARSRELRLRDMLTGVAVTEPLLHPGVVEDVAPSPDGSRLVTVDVSPEAVLWATRRPVVSPRKLASARMVEVLPGASRIVTGGTDGAVRWNGGDGQGAAGNAVQMDGAVHVLRSSPSGRFVVGGSSTGDVRLWGRGGAGELRLDWGSGSVASAAFGQDERMLAVLGRNSDLRFYRTSDGAALTPVIPVESVNPSVHGKGSWVVEFHPDGTTVAVGSYGLDVSLWAAGTTNRIGGLSHPLGAVPALAFAPDGSWLATGSFDGTVRIWDWATKAGRLAPMRHGSEVVSLAVSPDGSMVASGGNRGVVRLWRATDGMEHRELIGHAADGRSIVRDLRFRPDGRFLLSASADRTVRVWDVATGLMVSDPVRLEGEAVAAQWTRDGQGWVAAGGDGTGMITRTLLPGAGAPPWLPILADAMAGNVAGFNAYGEWERARGLAAGEPEGFYRDWARWFFGERVGKD